MSKVTNRKIFLWTMTPVYLNCSHMAPYFGLQSNTHVPSQPTDLGCLFPSQSWLIGHQWRHAPRMRALATELSSKQTWKSRPAKSLVSPYHPLGRQSRISCICGQTRPPPLPRIARLLQNHASVCSISLTFFKGWNSHNHVVCFWSLGLPKSHCLSLRSTEINSRQWKQFQPCWKNFS